jgi:nitrous oxide reductase accessory protein NosL
MKRIWLFASLLLLLIALPVLAGEKAPPQPAASDKCMVCGMFVAKYPDWTATIVFKDSVARFFDGPKDLFTYYFAIKKYEPKRDRPDIADIWVKDYYTLSFIDGRKAFYVIGSDVFGPMGKELIAFKSAADAKAFLKDHGGKKVLQFKDITPEVMKQLE